MGFLLSVNVRDFEFNEFPDTIKMFHIAHYFRSYIFIIASIILKIIHFPFFYSSAI
jgi:hypothetical protein